MSKRRRSPRVPPTRRGKLARLAAVAAEHAEPGGVYVQPVAHDGCPALTTRRLQDCRCEPWFRASEEGGVTCDHCGEPFLRKTRGRPPKFCKGACRVAACRARREHGAVLTAAELARRLGGEPEAAAAHLAYFESVGLADRVNGGYRPTARGVELGLAIPGDERGVPLTGEELRELRPTPGPARPREAAAA